MSRKIVINLIIFITFLTSVIITKQPFEPFVSALLLAVPILLEIQNDESKFSYLRNIFLIMSLVLIPKNIILTFLFFEMAILLEIGKEGIKTRPFSMVPLFLLALVLISVGSNGFKALANFNNDTIIFFLMGFRVLSELAHSHTSKLNLPCLYTLSIIFSTWWPWSDLILIGSFLVIVVINYLSIALRFKKNSQSLLNLILPLFLFGVLNGNYEVLMIYFINFILLDAIRVKNKIVREEMLILFSTLIFLVSSTIPIISLLELIGLILFLVASWTIPLKTKAPDGNSNIQMSIVSWVRFGVCILGVVFASV